MADHECQREPQEAVDRMDVDSEKQSPLHDQVTVGLNRWSTMGIPLLLPLRDELYSLAATLVRQNAVSFYSENSRAARAYWESLLEQTTISTQTSCFDPAVVSSFRVLNGFMMSKARPSYTSRLAHVQLIYFFDAVEEKVNSARQHGFVHRAAGYRNASIALDIYMSAQDGVADPAIRRRQLLERKRAGRRWKELAGPSPLFLLVYSDAAERIVYAQLPPL